MPSVDLSLLETFLADQLKEVRSRWPGISLDPSQFMAYLGERLDGEDLMQSIKGLNITDLYLACACSHGDRFAMRAFETMFAPEMEHSLSRFRFDQMTLKDIQQQLRLKLFLSEDGQPAITRYGGRSRLARWLKVVTLRHAIDVTRRENQANAGDIEALPVEDLDPEMKFLKATYRSVFEAAFTKAFRSISHHDRTIIKMFFKDKLDTRRIAVLYRMHRTTIRRWLTKVQEKLYHRTLAAVMEQEGVDTAQAVSIIRLMKSSIGISMSQCLRIDRKKRTVACTATAAQ